VIITQTPLRISFAGGGTDLPEYYREFGGEVVSAAVDKYIFVVLKRRFDRRIRIGYSKTELVESVDELKHELVREAMRITGVERGIEMSTLSDIPTGGSGLGSSSSVTVGVLNALWHYRFEPQPPEVLAQQASRIEVEILKKPMGKQDQFAAAYGWVNHIIFHSDGAVTVKPLELSEEAQDRLERHLLLLYTGAERKTKEILSDLRANINERFEILHRIKALVEPTCEALVSGDMEGLGRLLNENWALKRNYAVGATTDEIDRLYQRALDAGAYGGKISGAGGGGFFLFICPPQRRENVKKALGLPELKVRVERDGSKVIFNIRR